MSLPLDKLRKAPCVVTTEQDPTTCLPADGSGGGGDPDDPDVPPVDDDRCSDPAFYDANPDICRGYPRLILKPEYALVESGKTVQYKTYLRVSGNETLLSSGLTYGSSDTQVAIINTSTGLATGVQPGIGAINVAWQNLNAFAQIECVEACSEVSTQFLLLLDNSKSMKVNFSGTYSSKLTFSKAAARSFAESVNYDKDKCGVMKFTTAGTLLQAMTDDVDEVTDAIDGIGSTEEFTGLHAGLTKAIDYLDGVDGTIKVVVLFSDGEDNGTNNPLPLAEEFKNRGGVIVVIATRSWGTYFDTLYRIASTGFFLSAYEDTEADTITILNGLKTYLCSGDCQPTPGTYPTASLNFTGFSKWDVFQGAVDLVGLGIWDVQPGNGLYVDLVGTRTEEYPTVGHMSPGGLRSKDEFTLESGKTYRFSIDVAGNNVGASDDNEPCKVTIKDGSDVVVYTRTIEPDDHEMPFTTYDEEFTPDQEYTGCKIYIEAVEVKANNVGPLIDNVVLENVTDETTLLTDDFDGENEIEIPFGYTYYSCLTTPPEAQSADPNPPTPPLEG